MQIQKKVNPNPAMWEQDIYLAIAQDYPEVAKWPAVLQQVAISPEAGAGYYLVILGKPPRVAAIPVIIQDFKMKSFDVFIGPDETFWPLTERRLSEALGQHPLMRGLTAKEERLSPPANVAEMTRPPMSGYATGGFGNIATAQGMEAYASNQAVQPVQTTEDRGLLRAIRNTIYPTDAEAFYRHVQTTPNVVAGFAKNRTIHLVKNLIDSTSTRSGDLVSDLEQLLPKNVVWISKARDGWDIHAVSDMAFDIATSHGTTDQFVASLKKEIPNIATLLAANEDIFVIKRRISKEPVILDDEAQALNAAPITEAGEYIVPTVKDGILKGLALGPVHDFSGKNTGCWLFTDGERYSVQTSMSGEKTATASRPMASELSGGGMGCWIIQAEDGGTRVTMPFSVRAMGSASRDGGKFIRAVSYFGESVTFIVTPGIRGIVSRTGVLNPDLGQHLDNAIYAIGDDVIYMNVGSKATQIYESVPDPIKKMWAHGILHHTQPERMDGYQEILKVQWNGSGFNFSGKPAQEIGIHSSEDMGEAKAIFCLAVLGCDEAGARHVLNRARASKAIEVCGLRRVHQMSKYASAEYEKIAAYCNSIRRDLMKEAAEIPSESTVDAALALGFVNPENLDIFFEQMDYLKGVESLLARMLIYARMGHRELPEDSVLKAMTSLNEVNESLEGTNALSVPNGPATRSAVPKPTGVTAGA